MQRLDITCYNTYTLLVDPKTLRDELKMSRPFRSVEEEAILSIARTAAVIEHAGAEALKPFDLTITQYNVLRILRGAGGEGLCRNEVGERLVTKVPDVTRLLDRMEAAGLIVRQRGRRIGASWRRGLPTKGSSCSRRSIASSGDARPPGRTRQPEASPRADQDPGGGPKRTVGEFFTSNRCLHT